VINQAAAVVTLSDLTHPYDGTPKSATVTTNPAGLPVVVTYAGSATLPTAAGSYPVVATVSDPNYSGSATGTLLIEAASRLTNLSTRAVSLGGDRVIIPGFVIQGTGTKRVLVRAVGPKLQDFGVAEFLPDPVLSVYRDTTGSPLVASNDNWTVQEPGRPDPGAVGDQVGAFSLTADEDFPTNDTLSAAIVLDLEAGSYSTVAGDVLDRTGVGIVEVYDVNEDAGGSSRLINLSNRGFVGQGLQAMIPGFVVEGDAPRRYLIRAVGPKLADFGLPSDSLLANPRLRVMRGETEVANNDDWVTQTGGTTPAEVEAITASVGAFSLSAGDGLPTNDEMSASLVVTLEPGVYTVVVSGASGGTGIAIAEVYEVD
jgi:hypothetical protein